MRTYRHRSTGGRSRHDFAKPLAAAELPPPPPTAVGNRGRGWVCGSARATYRMFTEVAAGGIARPGGRLRWRSPGPSRPMSGASPRHAAYFRLQRAGLSSWLPPTGDHATSVRNAAEQHWRAQARVRRCSPGGPVVRRHDGDDAGRPGLWEALWFRGPANRAVAPQRIRTGDLSGTCVRADGLAYRRGRRISGSAV